jgi:class 3 adenylate cyclase
MSKNRDDFQLKYLLKLSRLIRKIKRPEITYPSSSGKISEHLYTRKDFTTTENLLTVVFWDIKNFSSLCDVLKTDSKLLIQFLREFFELARNIICARNGIVDKFLGDRVMAIFGFQNRGHDSSHDAVYAVYAAIELRERFEDLESRWVQEWRKHVTEDISLGLKCGINTGHTTIDNIGSKKRAHFTAIGNTVNIASRLADISDSGQIIVSATTGSKIAYQFELRSLGIVNNLKNISGSFEIFDVIKKKNFSCSTLG